MGSRSHPRAGRPVVVLALVGLLLASTGGPAVSAPGPPPLGAAFTWAANEFGVPRDLLVAVAYVETHLDNRAGHPSVDGGYGLMHLVANARSHTLADAAALLHVDPSVLKSDATQNVRGGAALLRDLADRRGMTAGSRSDLGAWRPVVAAYSGATSQSVASSYADEVFGLLSAGFAGSSPQGEILSVVSHPDLQPPAQYAAASPGPDYGSARWVPAASTNFDVANRPTDHPIDRIIIHVTDGSYSSAINWFQDPSAQVSAHYVIRSSDGQITQMVREKDIAWHAGNADFNARAIGVEHEGFETDPSWFTDAMYRSSAALVRALCLKYGVPMDRQHIIGHSEVPDPNHPAQFGGVDHHTDPGPNWNWDYYMRLVTSAPGTPAYPAAPLVGATYYTATRHNLGGVFHDYWNAYGGLAQFGYPITEEFSEPSPDTGQSVTVQYFERERFEYHPENAGGPYVVLLGRLGAQEAQSR